MLEAGTPQTLERPIPGARVVQIVAFSANRCIGVSNRLPWHLPEDLKRFRALTRGKRILLGRKTYDSIGRLLPDREHWILSRGSDVPGARMFRNFDEVKDALRALPESSREIWVIGGAEIYRQTLPWATSLEITRVKTEVAGDAFFPELPEGEFRCEKIEGAQDSGAQASNDNSPAYVFERWVRI